MDLTRFWAVLDHFDQDNESYEDDDRDEQDDPADAEEADEPAPGVTPEAIAAWEARSRVRLPEPLRTALQTQNGGAVRNTALEINALAEIVPVDDDFWEWTELEADEAPDHALVFECGTALDCGGTILLNFNTHGPTGPPSVLYDFHGEQTSHLADTIDEFFADQLAADDEPMIVWDEAEGQPDIIARETLTLSYGAITPTTLDQILARGSGGVILFTREQSATETRLTRMELPLPFDLQMTTIQPHRPMPLGTLSLHLYPTEAAGIRSAESVTDDDGRWKNSTSEGGPVYGQFEATDRARLQAIRVALLGADGAAQAEALESKQAAEVAQLAALTPEARQTMILQRMMNLLPPDQRAAMLSGSVDLAVQQVADAAKADGIPPELAEAAMAVRRRFAEAVQRFGPAANLPKPPENPDEAASGGR